MMDLDESASGQDFKRLCRTCMSESQNVISIFAEKPFGKIDAAVSDILNSETPIRMIIKGDGLPEQICNSCLQQLHTVHSFRELCAKTDDNLRKKYLNSNKHENGGCENYGDIKLETDNSKQDFLDVKIETGKDEIYLDTNKTHKEYDYDSQELWNSEDGDSQNEDIAEFLSKLPFVCEICQAIFQVKSAYRAHMRKRHSVFQCLHCSKSFDNREKLKIHQISHRKSHPFKCSKCPMSYKTKEYLRQHLERHSGKSKFICEICSKAFTKSDHLKSHTKLHSKPKEYPCTDCAKVYKAAARLEAHRKTHSTSVYEKKYLCDECGTTFTNNSSLFRHRLLHTNKKDFRCPQCKYVCRRKTHLDRHMLSHDVHRPRPFTCEECGKCFIEKNGLKKHMLLHLDVKRPKPFKCPCGHESAFKSYMDIHMMTHTGARPFSCTLCDQSFTRKTDLERHTMRHTGDKPFICQDCGHGFIQKSALTRHLRTHKHAHRIEKNDPLPQLGC